MSKRETTKVPADHARGAVVEGFRRARVYIRNAEEFARYADRLRQFSRDIGAEATYMQRLFEGKMSGISAAIYLAIVRELGMTEDDAMEIGPVQPFGSMKGMRGHGGARTRIAATLSGDVMRKFPKGEMQRNVSKEPEMYISVNDSIVKLGVSEYDVRATTSIGSSDALIQIQERPILEERSVPKSLIARMHPRSEPAIIRVSDDSMAPLYKRGACLLVDAGVRYPSPADVFVLWDGISHIVRKCQVQLGTSPIEVKVTATNPNIDAQTVPASTLHVAGQVFCELDPETWDEKTA